MDHKILHIYNDLEKIHFSAPKGVEEEAIRGIKRLNSKVSKIFRKTSKYLFLLGISIFILGSAPSIVGEYTSGFSLISQLLLNTAEETVPVDYEVTNKPLYYPPVDTKLPKQNTIKIPSVGISTSINEAPNESYEDALKKGVWRVPEFSQPFDPNKPVILAAHRFGYLSWSIPFRLKNSFYNLPKAKEGDIVEIDWNQRKYIYEIYSESKGDKITDYSADLILYTCETLNTNVRIFKYAKLIEI